MDEVRRRRGRVGTGSGARSGWGLGRLAPVLCAVLAGCATQMLPDGSTRLSLSPAALLAPTPASVPAAAPVMASAPPAVGADPALVRRVAARFVRDRRNGMAGVVSDIQGCYAAATRAGVNRLALRDCLALDFAAQLREQDNRRRFGVGTSDYLIDQAGLARVNQYAPLVFAGPDQTLAFLRSNGRAVYLAAAAF